MKKLLYIDDEEMNLEVFKFHFNDCFEVFTCESGPIGLETLNNNPGIELVISDMKMPEMSGIEFIKKAKELYPHIAYFILTGFDISDEITDSLNSGLIYKYFNKPLQVGEIKDTINGIIKCD